MLKKRNDVVNPSRPDVNDYVIDFTLKHNAATHAHSLRVHIQLVLRRRPGHGKYYHATHTLMMRFDYDVSERGYYDYVTTGRTGKANADLCRVRQGGGARRSEPRLLVLSGPTLRVGRHLVWRQPDGWRPTTPPALAAPC